MKITDKTLLELPLFQGMNADELALAKEDMQKTISHTKRGHDMVSEGDRCDALLFVVRGTVRCITESDDHSYSFEEQLHAPLLIEPDRLYGLSQRYSSRYVAVTACDTISIPKASVAMMMEHSMVFRINMLNMLSSLSQRRGRAAWHQQSEDIEKRIVRFIKDHQQYPAGQKLLVIKMVTLARELGCSRLEISQALHSLEQKELIIIRRSAVEIPMAERL